MDVAGSAGELTAALDFMRRYPAVWKDVLGFAICGAVGQVFICTFAFLFPPFSLALFLFPNFVAFLVFLCLYQQNKTAG